MPDFVITTTFKADDKVTFAFKKMTKGADKFGKKSEKSFKKASRSALSFKKLVGGILTAGVVQRGFSLLERGVSGVVTEFVQFDDAITAAAAKFDLIPKGTKEFAALEKAAREVGATTEFTSTQAGEGLRFLAKAGFDAEFAIKSLKSFVDLSTASEMEFSRATDIATDTMGAFGLNVDDTSKRMENLQMVNDVLSKAVNMANVDLEDLFETIKGAAPIAKQSGISIQKFTAVASFIGGAGIKGSLGATALKNAIINLAAPTPKMTKQLQKFGVTQKFVAKNIQDPVAVLAKLKDGLVGVGKAQKVAALATIFGRRAAAGMAITMDGGTKALNKFEQSLIDSKQHSKKLADLMRQSLGKKLAELESTAIEVGFKFLDAFKGDIPKAIDAAIAAIRKFDVKSIMVEVENVIEAFRGFDINSFVQGIEKVVRVTAKVVSTLEKISPAIDFINDKMFPFLNTAKKVFLAVGGFILDVIDNWDIMGSSLKESSLDVWHFIKTGFKNLFFGILGGVLTLGLKAKNILLGRDLNAGMDELQKNIAGGSLFRSDAEKGLPVKAERELPAPRQAPNQAEIERSESSEFRAFLDFQNAPKDLTFIGAQGSPKVEVEGLGAQ